MRKIIFILLVLVPAFLKAQIITTFGGNGTYSSSGDGGPATAAGITIPVGGTFDKYGNYYIAQCISGNRVRKINTAGIITTVTGNGSAGFSGDGGPATAAKVSQPEAITFDTSGNLYIADAGNNRIRKIDANTGVISTIVGTGAGSFGGDGGPATAANIYNPFDVCFDKFGNLYIVDFFNNRVRKVNPFGIITTIAGSLSSGFAGDGGPSTASALNNPEGIAADTSGNIYIADRSNGRVRKINTAGIISTVAGSGPLMYGGYGMPATAAQIAPTRLAFDDSGNLFISDSYNNRVYKVDFSGILHLVAGNGLTTGPLGDGGPATSARINQTSGIAIDPCGNLYIAQNNTNIIRKVTFNPTCNPSLEISQIKSVAKISIYPNPTSTLLHIDNIKPNTTYQLLSIVGAVMQSGDLKEGGNTISMQHLAPGMYLLHLTDEAGERVVTKIIKQQL